MQCSLDFFLAADSFLQPKTLRTRTKLRMEGWNIQEQILQIWIRHIWSGITIACSFSIEMMVFMVCRDLRISSLWGEVAARTICIAATLQLEKCNQLDSIKHTRKVRSNQKIKPSLSQQRVLHRRESRLCTLSSRRIERAGEAFEVGRCWLLQSLETSARLVGVVILFLYISFGGRNKSATVLLSGCWMGRGLGFWPQAWEPSCDGLENLLE